MIIVADSSPVNILVRLGCIDILPQLFGTVLIPPQVREELLDERTPSVVRKFISSFPQWLQIRSPSKTEPFFSLDPGESAAIRLALETNADALLIDEKDGRREASSRGLKIIGTLGVLDQAAKSGLIDFHEMISRLKRTDFRIDPLLLKRFEEFFDRTQPPP